MNLSLSSPTALYAFLAGTASALSAQSEWILIDRDFLQQRIELTQLQNESIVYVNEDGNLREQSIHELLAIIHERPPKARAPREMPWITRQMELFGQTPLVETEPTETYLGTLALTDGQRWVGTLAGTHGDSLSWLLEDSIVLDTPIEYIISASIHAPLSGMSPGWAALNDRVLLRNGDVLDGYIVEIGKHLRVESAGGDSRLPLDRVVGFVLANPPTTPTGFIVRTAAGSIVTASTISITVTGRVSAVVGDTPQSGTMSLHTTDLQSLLFAPNAFASLALIEPSMTDLSNNQLETYLVITHTDNSLGIDSLELHGPMRVEWVLPHPAARFVTTATLPSAMWSWGDCEVVIYTGEGSEAARELLNADRPTVEINVPLGGQTKLSIEIVSKRGGDVQDRVILTRPMITWQSTEP